MLKIVNCLTLFMIVRLLKLRRRLFYLVSFFDFPGLDSVTHYSPRSFRIEATNTRPKLERYQIFNVCLQNNTTCYYRSDRLT